MRSRLQRALCALFGLSLATACSRGPSAEPEVGQRSAAVLGDAAEPIALALPYTSSDAWTQDQERYYRITVPADHDGLRLSAGCPAGCTLTLRREDPISGDVIASGSGTGAFSVFVPPDATVADDGWYLHVTADAAETIELWGEAVYARELSWDAGETAEGSVTSSRPDTRGGSYLYRVTAQAPAYGAFRQVLRVTAGEADLFAQAESFPGDGATHQSTTPGSDGLLIGAQNFAENQTWYIRVVAQSGAEWSLLAGDVFVQDLGTVAADDSGSGQVTVGPEGVAFFHANVASGTKAWRLWARSSDPLYVRKDFVPLPGDSAFDRYDEAGQLLLVPPYLTSGGYFGAVTGSDGQLIDVDSRQQAIRNPQTQPGYTGTGTFAFSLNGTDDSGYGFITYRVDVPVQQIGWQLKLTSQTGNADLYARQGEVPNASENDAYSEVGASVADSVTFVPPTLTNGAWYVTVRGEGSFSFTLRSDNPTITNIAFINDPVAVQNGASFEAQNGWRYFRVSDIPSQVGKLGWILELQNQVPESEIALRPNALPGRWQSRHGGGEQPGGHVEFSSTTGFLERVQHEADVWYVGVYTPDAALGAFSLRTRSFEPAALGFANGSASSVTQTGGRWAFYKVIVPSEFLGWDLRLTDVIAGTPRMVVRREQLPDYFPGGGFATNNWLEWPSGGIWVPNGDWTLRGYTAGGEIDRTQLIATGRGPLVPGTYYVGVYTDSDAEYSLQSRGIATPSGPLGIATLSPSGSTSGSGLPPREAAYYKVTIPEGMRSWGVVLHTTSGEAMLCVKRGALPNSECQSYYNDLATSAGNWRGTARQKTGDEYFYLYPPYDTQTIPSGDYYLAVIGEGQDPEPGQIGAGTSDYTLEALGELPVVDVTGTALTVGTPYQFPADNLAYGERRLYRLRLPGEARGAELRFASATGSPVLGVAVVPPDTFGITSFPTQYTAPEHGLSGAYDAERITLADPSGDLMIAVAADTSGTDEEDANYELEVLPLGDVALDFNGGAISVAGQEAGTWRYFAVTVPAGGAGLTGWDLRLHSVSSGTPQLVVRRDDTPQPPIVSDYSPEFDSWPSGWQWAAGNTWSRRDRDNADAVDEFGRQLIMGFDSPLVPGNYVVGVFSDGDQDMSYTLESRGIGEGGGWAIQIETLPLTGSVANGALAARDNDYYRLDVPDGLGSLSLELTTASGDAFLAVRQGNLPDMRASSLLRSDGLHGTRRQKGGEEFFYKYPDSPATTIPPGTYYVVVSGEGNADAACCIGSGTTDYTLTSHGEQAVEDARATPVTEQAPLSWTGQSLRFEEQRAYRFTVPEGPAALELHLRNVTGRPIASVLAGDGAGTSFPHLGFSYSAEEGGWYATLRGEEVLSLADPSGEMTVIVTAQRLDDNSESGATYDLELIAVGDASLPFNGGQSAVVAQGPGTWRYFEVVVPEDALGWELKLVDVQSGSPALAVRRGLPPDGRYTTPWLPDSDVFPEGANWAPYTTWSRRDYAAGSGESEAGRELVMGMGSPLEPGTYYVGITDDGSSDDPMSYTLRSGGIGRVSGGGGAQTVWSIPVQPLTFEGGSEVVADLPARDNAFFELEVPAQTEGFAVVVAPDQGESFLSVAKDRLPNSSSSALYLSAFGSSFAGTRRQKDGAEYFYAYPPPGERYVPAGTYFIAVGSEGESPEYGQIGSGSSSFEVHSLGAVPVLDVRATPVTPATPAQWTDQELEAGAQRVYRVRVPAGTELLETRLENRTGNPGIAFELQPFGSPRIPGTGISPYGYRADEGYGLDWHSHTINKVDESGDATIVVATDLLAGEPSAASYDLWVRAIESSDLDFDGGLVDDSLEDGQRRIYRVEVPELVDGEPPRAWSLALDVATGTADLRVRPDVPPSSLSGSTQTMQITQAEAILAAPWLTPGTWYIEVSATGLTEFALASKPVRAVREWTMPEADETPTTPGVSPPAFADTGVDDDGQLLLNPETGDPGTDLAEAHYDFYRVLVPANNAGLLQTRLEAISGDPQLFIRHGGVPAQHSANGPFGPELVDRRDWQTGSTYGSWAVTDQASRGLPEGETWIAVYAHQSNVRYRLTLTIGDVQPLSQDGGQALGRVLAAGDMHFYRVQIPQSSLIDASSSPLEWNVALNQQSGDVVLFVRAGTPPGHLDHTSSGYDSTAFVDWSWQPGCANCTRYQESGTYQFGIPPIRPAVSYYLGVYAVVDTQYDIGSTIGSERLHLDGIYPYTGAALNVSLPDGATRLYRIDVPADAVRWKHTSVHHEGVSLWLDSGTVPTDGYALAQSYWSDWGLNQPLDRSGYDPRWRSDGSYYLLVHNQSGDTQQVQVTFDGRNAMTDDEDGDPLPDYWEWEYFASLDQGPDDDADSDGSNNLAEFTAGTHPLQADSDNDGLSDGQEPEFGTDPLDPDSDDDLVLDGDDGAPTDPANSAPVIDLALGEVDTGQYGRNYGSDEHGDQVRARFQGQSASVWLQIVGYDIEADDEAEVLLNGTPIGHVSRGANAATSLPTLFAISQEEQLPGANQVAIRQSTNGETWGVTSLALYPSDVALGNLSSLFGQDQSHPQGYDLVTRQLSESLLELHAFDADTQGEVALELDGEPFAELPAGPNGDWSPHWQLLLAASDLGDDEIHRLGVRAAAGGDGEWGLRMVTARPLQTYLGEGSDEGEDQHLLDSVHFLFPRGAAREVTLSVYSDPSGMLSAQGTALLPASDVGSSFFAVSRAEQNSWFEFVEALPGSFVVNVNYYGPVIDSDGDNVTDDLDPFPLDYSESADADHDGVGDNADPDDDGDGLPDDWEETWFGDLTTAGALTDTDGDGSSDVDEYVAQTNPLCADLDEDGFDGLTSLCQTGNDCDDSDDDILGSANDADCDGTVAAQDCDDGDPESAIRADDGDCDGIATADDCDDENPYATLRAHDADCDGAVTVDDCDDDDPHSAIRAHDADCDDIENQDDAFPNDPHESSDNDGDGLGDHADVDDDDDNLLDLVEVQLGTSPWTGDSDADGIADDIEIGDPDAPLDSDGDGTLDALDSDSDADGRTDAEEAPNGELIDSDGDGLPDYRDPDSGSSPPLPQAGSDAPGGSGGAGAPAPGAAGTGGTPPTQTPPPKKKGGCAVQSASDDAAGFIAAVLAASGLLWRRRRQGS